MNVPSGVSRLLARRLDPLTAVEQSVARLQDEGVRYTRRQLYYEVCRTLLEPLEVYPVVSRTMAVVGASLALVAGRLHPIRAGVVNAAALVSTPSLVWRLPFTITPPITEAAFAEALTACCTRYGQPAGLLADELPPPPRFAYREPDLYDYGVPYALICQDATIARMLRANALHMEMGCPILALEEASPLPEDLVNMLLLTHAPYILLLHDASPEGLTFAAVARELLNLPSGIHVRASGLYPRHALRQHLFALRRASAPYRTPITLGTIEHRWLCAGYAAEVAALRPVRLLRALRRIVHPQRRRPSWFAELRRWPSDGHMSWPQ